MHTALVLSRNKIFKRGNLILLVGVKEILKTKQEKNLGDFLKRLKLKWLKSKIKVTVIRAENRAIRVITFDQCFVKNRRIV